MGIERCRIIDLPRFEDPRRNLTVIESGRHVPFELKKVFYLYDVPGGAARAGYALKMSHQFLYIPPMIWREIDNFSSNSVRLVLASEFFSEEDYYRDYEQFVAAVRA